MSAETSHTSNGIPFISGYAPPASSYDEMCAAGGMVRSQWEYLIRSLATLSSHELARREQEVQRFLREDGVTYNVYNDPRGAARLWELDLVPLLVTSQEWSTIERGLTHRAELFNLVLADLFRP